MASRLWLILILALQPVLALSPALATANQASGEPVVCCPICTCEGCPCAADAPQAPEAPEPMAPAPAPKLVAPSEPECIRASECAPSVPGRPAAATTTRRTAAGLASIRLLGVWRT